MGEEIKLDVDVKSLKSGDLLVVRHGESDTSTYAFAEHVHEIVKGIGNNLGIKLYALTCPPDFDIENLPYETAKKLLEAIVKRGPA